MSRTGKKRRGRAGRSADRDLLGKIQRRERIAVGQRLPAQGRWGSWMVDKRSVFRFVILLGVGMVGFNVLFFLWLVPGEPFHPTGGGKNTMRINFSNATHEEIQIGIERIGEAIGEKLARQIA